MSALLHHEMIKTTVPKAKEAARMAEKVGATYAPFRRANNRSSRTASATPTRHTARPSPSSS